MHRRNRDILLLSSSALNPIQRALKLVGMASSWRDVTYMFAPPLAPQGKEHYLYINGQWVDPTTLDTSMGAMVGTLNADGTGGSLSYTPEIVAPTTVEAVSVLYTNTNVVVPILSIGFNRSLTAAERTSLAGLVSPIATAAGLSPAACSLVTGQEFQQRCLKLKVNTALAGSANDSFILPAAGSGTYAYTVDWGNGTREYVTANTAQTKDYDATGTFVVKCYGTYRPYFNNGGDKAKLIGLQIGATNHTLFSAAFKGCSALVTMVGYANTENVTATSNMFEGCAAFNQSVANFNTAKVTNMSLMFRGCAAFNQSVANFNTAEVTNMSIMFWSCVAFNQSVANFNTAKVTDMTYMFFGCSVFNQSVANFNTAEVTNMSFMFWSCVAFNQSVANFNTAKVTDMTYMFFGCSVFNQSVANFNTAKVTNMSLMFRGCAAFNQSVANFNTAEVTNMSTMFWSCVAFNQSVANFNTAKVTNMSAMFQNCTAFKRSLATFNMEAVSTVTDMLAGCNINETGTTTNYDATLIAWAAQNLVDSKTFTATNCKYGGDAGSGGQQARTAIATDDSWTFVDGGHI